MEKALSILRIVDTAIKDITKRVARIDLYENQADFDESGDVCTLSVDVGGAYKITIVYNAEERLLRTIAEHMKRAPVEDSEEVAMYTKEYFNILCGHVVSSINRLTNSSARFGIPDYAKGVYSLEQENSPFFEICYQSGDGDARIQGICAPEYAENPPLSSLSVDPADLPLSEKTLPENEKRRKTA